MIWTAPAERKTEQQSQRAASRQSGDGAFGGGEMFRCAPAIDGKAAGEIGTTEATGRFAASFASRRSPKPQRAVHAPITRQESGAFSLQLSPSHFCASVPLWLVLCKQATPWLFSLPRSNSPAQPPGSNCSSSNSVTAISPGS